MAPMLRRTLLACSVAGVLCAAAPSAAEAQVDRRDVPLVLQPQQRFDTGQDVQPIYEGWQRNPDGGITLHFGYLNRNYREQPSIPVGPDNFFSPGEPDRGQPAYFYPRTHRFVFSVPAPEGMGTALEDGVVWTLRHNGSEQTAVAWLQPEWEIDEDTIVKNTGLGFGRAKAEWYSNQPPRLTVSAERPTVATGQPLRLTAVIADDELPGGLPPQRSSGGTGKPSAGCQRLHRRRMRPPCRTTSRGTGVRGRRATGCRCTGSSTAGRPAPASNRRTTSVPSRNRRWSPPARSSGATRAPDRAATNRRPWTATAGRRRRSRRR